MMKRTLNLLLFFYFLSFTIYAASGELKEKLCGLDGIRSIQSVESNHYKEKYVVFVNQEVNHGHPEDGMFEQRVIVSHVGFDKPTILVTEGYGGAYALSPNYQEELSYLLGANVVFVEHRYFLESTPDPLNWEYLTAENSAYDLHHITQMFKEVYPNKWISTGISKGGQTTLIYRTFFPDDVDISVPYVGPLCKAVEDGRHETFLKKVGTKKERRKIQDFQLEVLKRKANMVPLLDDFCKKSGLTFRIPMEEVLDYCVLEYSFSLWQWGTPINNIPSCNEGDNVLFNHLMRICGPEYFAKDQPNLSFFVQAARELGYYGYDTAPFRKYLSIQSAEGYLERIMLPENLKIDFNPALYNRITHFLKENDPKIIFIYGEIDPWSAVRVPSFKGKKNEQVYIQPRGSHLTRIGNMPEDIKIKILTQLNEWLAE